MAAAVFLTCEHSSSCNS